MPTLLEKIEADAAKRLSLPAGRQPAQELARYKAYLKVQAHRLKMLHHAGAGGREVSRARAAVLDLLMRYVLEAVRNNLPAEVQRNQPEFALVAIGGYGRGELNPHSDIDIMLLHDGDSVMASHGQAHPFLTALTNPGGLLYTLYDIGLKVGHSTRNAGDCVRIANSDMQSKTSLIEARLIYGSKSLFERMQNVVLAKCVRGHEDAYITARLEDQAARRKKFGDAVCMQEPNIKNGSGGLRDYQNLFWMAYFKHRIRSLTDMEKQGMLTAIEGRQLEAAYDFLLRARNELHYHLNRAGDVLTKAVQPSVAYNLGYTDRSPSRRLEAFMRDYYTHARHINFITRSVEQRLALVPKPRRLPSLRDLIRLRRVRAAPPTLVDGLRFENGQIHAGSPRIFKEQPRRLMRVFLHVQQRGLKLHPDLAHLIRNSLPLVDGEFRRDPHVQETFLEILNQRGNVASILRQMHEVDLLGKYLPEFGGLTCLVQHEFYHQYTADEHTLMCLQKLDDLWFSQTPLLAPYVEVLRQIERPFVLSLAVLLHDVGKASGKPGHSEAGGKLAKRVARRLNLDAHTTHTLKLLIENHVMMAQASQRRDLGDPAEIRKFAKLVETAENLNLLLLHTLADSLGTSDKLWNGFKDALLWSLHRKTLAELQGGTAFLRAEEKARERLAQEVRRILSPAINEEEIQAHFANLPARYFQSHLPQEIAADLSLIHRFLSQLVSDDKNALNPVVAWHPEPDRGGTLVKTCTWDRAGLFSKIAGSFTAAGLNILSAQIYTREDGVILDTFFVTDAESGTLVNKEKREHFETLLTKALTVGVDFHALIKRRKTAQTLYQSLEGERIPTIIHFDTNASETRTVVDLETEDRVGLLYAVSQALSSQGIDIVLAKITTEKGAATDSFYISELDGSPITSPERQRGIEAKLRNAIAGLDHA
jgi:[protein-PII] uridylyltransferase